jgi:hypothetical protein
LRVIRNSGSRPSTPQVVASLQRSSFGFVHFNIEMLADR